MHTMLHYLTDNPVFTLFLIIGIGFALSHLKYKGVGLGVAFVLFTGIGFGALGADVLDTPEQQHQREIVAQIGLVLFVYTIGLQAGPSFFRILRKKGLGLSLLAVVAISLAALVAWLNSRWFSLDPILATGLFCGALTNTPALAAATQYLQGHGEAYKLTIGYSVAYPFGVILPILWSQWIVRRRHLDVARETRRAERQAGEQTEPPATINVLITRPEATGKRIDELLPANAIASRLMRDGNITIPTRSTRLAQGDILHVVGTSRNIHTIKAVLGEESLQPGPEMSRSNIDFRRIMLTNDRLVGHTLAELQLEEGWGAVVTRVRRGDTDFVPTPHTRLERGDRLRVVAPADKMAALTQLLGDRFKTIAETDYFSFAGGILIGLVLGSLPIPLGGGLTVKLGLAGGPLLAGLLLGYLGRTGHIYWSMPLNTNLTLRQLGLVLFFAVVGIKAGGSFADALQAQGLQLLLAGALITSVLSIGIMAGAMRLLRMDWVTATGTLGGAQTQPAILSYIGELSQSESPNSAYAAIMPVAMIIKIILAQLLLYWMM